MMRTTDDSPLSPTPTPPSSDQLRDAIDNHDSDLLQRLLNELRATWRALTEPERAERLRQLRKSQLFTEVIELAAICPTTYWPIIEELSLAQVGTGRLTRAIDALESATPSCRAEKDQRLGRLGRIYKQLYLDAAPTAREPRVDDLERALKYYGEAFERSATSTRWDDDDAPYWHGINLVALQVHGANLATEPKKTERLKEAKAIAAVVRQAATRDLDRDDQRAWARLTLAEACLIDEALHDEAVEHLEHFIDEDEDASYEAFAFERQLRELWGFDQTTDLGRRLLLPLQEAKARSLSTQWKLGGHEKIFTDTPPERYQAFKRIVERAKGMVRIESRVGHEIIGSGFVIAADLLVTCRHVATDYRPEELIAVFTEDRDENGEPRTVRCVESLWTGIRQGRRSYDACLLRLEKPVPLANVVPVCLEGSFEKNKRSRAYVLSHPGGADLHVSVHDSKLLHFNPHVIQYRSGTMRGSSGAAVFNRSWKVIGIHGRGSNEISHARFPDRKIAANEGVRFDQVWPFIEHYVRSSWQRHGTPKGFKEPLDPPAPPPKPGVAPSTDVDIESPRRDEPALWRSYDPTTEKLSDVVNHLTGHESMWPLFERDKRQFEFTFVFGEGDSDSGEDIPPQLLYRSGRTQMSDHGNVIINQLAIPGTAPGQDPYFLLIIKGVAEDHRGRRHQARISGNYRDLQGVHEFGPGELGRNVVVVIPSTMSPENPVQVITFDVTAATDDRKETYDPLMVFVPQGWHP